MLPADDVIWEYRDRTLASLARASGYGDVRDASRDLSNRGFRWVRGAARMIEAPCARCRVPFAVDEDTDDRLCLLCREPEVALTPNQRLFRREYARRAKKIGTPEWMERYQRPGGPEMRGMRRAR